MERLVQQSQEEINVKRKETREELICNEDTRYRKKKSTKAGGKREVQFSSVTQSFHSLQPHGPQHARLPCPSPTPGACSNSCPLSW